MKNNTKIKEVEKAYDEFGNEIGTTNSEGVTHYYDTPEARAFFTRKTGHKFDKE